MKRYREKDFWYELTQGPDPTTGRPMRYVVITCRECKQTASSHAHGMADEKLRKVFMRQNWYIGKTVKSHLCPSCQHKIDDSKEPTATLVPRNEIFHAWASADLETQRQFLLMAMADSGQYENLQLLLADVGLVSNTESSYVPPEPDMSWFNPDDSAEDIAKSVIDRFGIERGGTIAAALLDLGGRVLVTPPGDSADDIVRCLIEHFGKHGARPIITAMADQLTALLPGAPHATPLAAAPEPEPEPAPVDDDDAPADWWLELKNGFPLATKRRSNPANANAPDKPKRSVK